MSSLPCKRLAIGAVLVLASVLRLGFFADFVSYPVQVGFRAGIGFVIVALDILTKLFLKSRIIFNDFIQTCIDIV